MVTPIGYLTEHSIFHDLSRDDLKVLQSICVVKIYSINEIIFNEGDISQDLYLNINGLINVRKYDKGKKSEFIIANISPGEIFGEMSFVDESTPRSATLISSEPSEILILDRKALLSLGNIGLSIYQKLVKNIAKISVDRLRLTNIGYVEKMKAENVQLQLRTEFGKFFIAIILTLDIASILTKLATEYNFIKEKTLLYEWIYLLVISIPTLWFIHYFNYRLSTFGVTFKNWKQSFTEGLIICSLLFLSIFAIFIPFIKHIGYVPIYNYKIFHLIFLNYLLGSYIQEFFARGVIQTSLLRFLNDKKGYMAIFITSAIFATFHIHQSLISSLVIFIASIFLGIIYNRHQNLIGVSLVHFTLGAIGVYFGIIH